WNEVSPILRAGRPPCGTIRGTFGRGPYVRSNVGPVEPLSTLRNRSELNVRLWVTSRHRLMVSALGHVWTAPWQELSDAAAALVGCGHVSGLFVRRSSRWP